jgi:putative tRNA adenosine deaminase-associated protein
VDTDIDEPRVFVSDGSAAETYELAGILAGSVEDDAPADEDAPPPESEPVGDPDLLADLGTPRRELLSLVTGERTLPADVISEVCERAGCLEELDALRGV